MTLVNVIWIHFPWKALAVYGSLPSELRHWRSITAPLQSGTFFYIVRSSSSKCYPTKQGIPSLKHLLFRDNSNASLFSFYKCTGNYAYICAHANADNLPIEKSFKGGKWNFERKHKQVFVTFCCVIMLIIRGTVFENDHELFVKAVSATSLVSWYWDDEVTANNLRTFLNYEQKSAVYAETRNKSEVIITMHLFNDAEVSDIIRTSTQCVISHFILMILPFTYVTFIEIIE